MAPEQIQSHPRLASDQYALGITVYEWLTGERPFQGSFSEIAAKQLMTPPPALRDKLAYSGSPTQTPVPPAWRPATPAPVEPIKRSRMRNTVLFVFLALLVIVGATSYPLWSQYISSRGSTTGQTSTTTNTAINNTTPAQGNTNSNGPGRNCKKIGVLLPETATSVRWENNDKPQLEQQIPQALPGTTVDYNNAQGDATNQLNQAQADLTNGDCILVVAAADSVAAAQIVTAAKARNVPVIAYDRLIQSQDLAYYVSFDNVAVGKIQGQYVADHYQVYVSGGHINTVMINGSQTDNNALLFYQGAASVLNPLYSAGTLKKIYDQVYS